VAQTFAGQLEPFHLRRVIGDHSAFDLLPFWGFREAGMSVSSEMPFQRGGVPLEPVADPRENNFLLALPPTAYATLRQYLTQREFSPGRILWNAGDRPAQLYFPQSGLISMRVPTTDGYGIETGSIGREGVAGIESTFGADATVTFGVAQIGGTYTTIDSEIFFQAVQRNRAIAELAGLAQQWVLWQAQHMAACNATHSAEARLCRWLLLVSDRTENPTIPTTQESIADALGLRRTTITLLTHDLETAGAIHNTRGKIKIRNRALLQDRACSCCDKLARQNWPSTRLTALTGPALHKMSSINPPALHHQRGA
jgi:CRP-like cAMP-binding protein